MNNEYITVTVNRVAFQNEETGYSVMKSSSLDYPNGLTLVGKLPFINLGEEIRVYGTWTSHPQFGEQFQVFECAVMKPKTEERMEENLSSGIINGIGPSIAKLLVNCFGVEAIDIIENSPERLLECPDIGNNRKDKIVDGWASHCRVRDIIIFLQGHGISHIYASKIFSKYKRKAIAKISANPYLLAYEINNISFKKVDAIAAEFGITTSDPRRIRACIMYVLLASYRDGHTYVMQKYLQVKVIDMLKLDDVKVILISIQQLILKKLIIRFKHEEVDLLYLSHSFEAEHNASLLIASFLQNKVVIDQEEISRELDCYCKHEDTVSSKMQKKAVELSLNNRLCVITDGPSIDKEEILKALVSVHLKLGRKVLVASVTGQSPIHSFGEDGPIVQTVYDILEYSAQNECFGKNVDNKLDCNTLILDETSMIDSVLFYAILKAIPESSSIIFLGDDDQLPSIGPGMVLSELISSKRIPVVSLFETFDLADTSFILKNAKLIKNGKMPMLMIPNGELETDCYYVHADEPEKTIRLLKNIVGKSLPSRFSYDAIKDIQILTPMNKGRLGTINLNSEIQSFLNPYSSEKAEFEHTRRIFRIGDKVIYIKDNYRLEICNGDIGFIKSVSAEDHEIIVEFCNKEIRFQDDELLDLAHAYAITVQKSQGRKYRAVIMVISTQHFPMLKRSLLYTGVTRAKERMVLLGAERPINIAVKNNKIKSRNTILGSLIDLAMADTH